MDELIAKLEAAAEGSAALDYDIFRTIKEYDRSWLTSHPPGGLPQYTTSIDAALTLVPAGMPVDLHIGPRGLGNDAVVHEPRRSTDDRGRRVTSYAPHECRAVRDGVVHWTPAPLALCLAAIKARQAQESEKPAGPAEAEPARGL